MPDHVHILLFFVELPTQEILGRILARFKVEVNKVTGTDGVFAKGFNDQILKSTRTLDTFYKYIRDNARRLAVRRAHPEFFPTRQRPENRRQDISSLRQFPVA